LLARVTASVGRGRGFAVHKALDQVGAFAGPLLVAGVIALAGVQWPAFVVLALPGAACMLLLLILRRHLGDAEGSTTSHPIRVSVHRSTPASTSVDSRPLSRDFYAFAVSSGFGTMGLMTFGVIAYHLVDASLVRTAVVPLLYAAAMAAEAVAALATGFAYDRWGAAILFVLPAVIIAVPALSLSDTVTLVVGGVLLWGAATGVQDSTVKALVADLVPQRRLASAYGVFAAFQGVAALIGGTLAGGLYTKHRALLISLVGLSQAASAFLLAIALRGRSQRAPGPRR
jgi:hypothetical protein